MRFRIAVLLVLMGVSPAVGAEKPNIVFFLVDDLGFMDIHPNNPDTFYETPNLDRLAAEGMRFTQGYSACPVCSPTRASILTGRYPPRTGITDYIGAAQPEKWDRPTRLLPAPYRTRLEHSEKTLAEICLSNGYATFFAGKWHLGPEGHYPENQGFQFNLGGFESGGPYRGKQYFSPYDNPRLTDGPPGEHLPDRLANETVKFIREHRDGPFLAYFSFYSVHTPLMARADLKLKYEEKAKRLNQKEEWGKERERRVRLTQNHPVFAGMVEAMDQAVGKVLNTLDELGLAENTIVVFTSDNGGLATSEGHPTANYPLRAGKGWLYEGGVRVPWIVRYPPIVKKGSIGSDPVLSTDFLPTLLELTKLPEAGDLDGKSFTPALRGEAHDRGALYWHYPHYGNQGGAPSAAIRKGDWKLIRWYEDESFELFHLRNDPSERNNLVDQEPDVVVRLKEELAQWLTSVDAKFPTVKTGK